MDWFDYVFLGCVFGFVLGTLGCFCFIELDGLDGEVELFFTGNFIRANPELAEPEPEQWCVDWVCEEQTGRDGDEIVYVEKEVGCPCGFIKADWIYMESHPVDYFVGKDLCYREMTSECVVRSRVWRRC